MSNFNKEEMFQQIKEYMKNINGIIRNIVDDIRENNNISNLVDILDGLAYCFRGLNLTKELHNISIDENNFKEKVEEILEATQNEDYNLIADIVEYEILENVENLNIKLENI